MQSPTVIIHSIGTTKLQIAESPPPEDSQQLCVHRVCRVCNNRKLTLYFTEWKSRIYNSYCFSHYLISPSLLLTTYSSCAAPTPMITMTSAGPETHEEKRGIHTQRYIGCNGPSCLLI